MRVVRSRSMVPPAVSTGALAVATIYVFALLPILWERGIGGSSFVWTFVSAALMLFAAVMCRADRLDTRPLTLMLGAFLVLYLVFAVISYLVTGTASNERYNWMVETYRVMPLAAIYYAFGLVLGGRGSRFWLMLAVAGGAAHAIASIDSTSVQALWEREQSGQTVTYQYAGDAFAISALLLLGALRKAGLRMLVILGAIVVLFLIPSRSSALVGITSMLIWAMLFTRQRLAVVLTAIVCVVLAWQLGWLSREALETAFAGSRFESLATGAADSSKEARDQVLAVGWQYITESLLIGHFGFQVDRFSDSGLYIHNALDIWAQTGIIPFAAFVLMWAWVIIRSSKRGRRMRRRREVFAGALLFSLISWVIARHTSTGLLYLPLGVASAYLAGHGAMRRSTRRSHAGATSKRRRRSSRRSGVIPGVAGPAMPPIVMARWAGWTPQTDYFEFARREAERDSIVEQVLALLADPESAPGENPLAQRAPESGPTTPADRKGSGGRRGAAEKAASRKSTPLILASDQPRNTITGKGPVRA